jgi:hypothetical protein
MIEIRRTGESYSNLETCVEFRNVDIKAFVRHLHERRCEKCLALFAAVRQGTARSAIFAREQKSSEVRAAEGRLSAARSNDRTIDRWLSYEYFLIPQLERPMAGSNEWFRWLEEFQQRHPVEVSRLGQPLANRACQVLWNSK